VPQTTAAALGLTLDTSAVIIGTHLADLHQGIKNVTRLLFLPGAPKGRMALLYRYNVCKRDAAR
jgi:hypothetical protein